VFDGTNYLEIPYTPALNTPEFTVSVWVYPLSSIGSGLHTIFSSPSLTSGEKGYILYIYANKWRFYLGTGSAWVHVDSIPMVATNEWTFLTVTYDGVISKVYLNGVENVTLISSMIQNTDRPLRIGVGSAEITPDYYFQGKLQDFRYYDRPLSQTEITNIYTTGTAIPNPKIPHGPSYTESKMLEGSITKSGQSVPNVGYVPSFENDTTLLLKDLKHSIFFDANCPTQDLTGNSTLTLHNNPTIDYDGIYFDRTNSQYANLGATNIGGTLTFAIWVNVHDTSQTSQRIINFQTDTNTELLLLAQSGSDAEFIAQIYQGSTYQSTSDTGGGVNFSVSMWYHIV
jgi:hypothetical protein